MLVQNGVSYEKAILKINSTKFANIQQLLISNKFNIEFSNITNIELYVAKRLAFAGHPGNKMSISKCRKLMGCAYTFDNITGILSIGTFGEWSCMEGGASIDSICIIPNNINIEIQTTNKLHGTYSQVNKKHFGGLIIAKNIFGQAWYGDKNIKTTWKKLKFIPDIENIASSYQKPDDVNYNDNDMMEYIPFANDNASDDNTCEYEYENKNETEVFDQQLESPEISYEEALKIFLENDCDNIISVYDKKIRRWRNSEYVQHFDDTQRIMICYTGKDYAWKDNSGDKYSVLKDFPLRTINITKKEKPTTVASNKKNRRFFSFF